MKIIFIINFVILLIFIVIASIYEPISRQIFFFLFFYLIAGYANLKAKIISAKYGSEFAPLYILKKEYITWIGMVISWLVFDCLHLSTDMIYAKKGNTLNRELKGYILYLPIELILFFLIGYYIIFHSALNYKEFILAGIIVLFVHLMQETRLKMLGEEFGNIRKFRTKRKK